MKRKLTLRLALLLISSIFATVAIGCGATSPYDNKTYGAIQRGAKLDDRFQNFHMIQINGDSLLLLNNEKGLSAIYFTPTVDDTNQKLLCTINGIYVIDVTTPSHNLYGSTGHITNPAYITECIGEQTTFTLYVNSEGVVTSDDLPALLPENTVK